MGQLGEPHRHEAYDRRVPDADARYTADEVDAAVAALAGEPERLGHAQELVTHAAPGLQQILNESLEAGGWFGAAHEEQVARAAGEADGDTRLRAVRTLVAEETRIGMLVGVAVGFELARELARSTTTEGD
jgi:hypothetical protein